MRRIFFARIPTPLILVVAAVIVLAGLVSGSVYLAVVLAAVWTLLRLSYNRWLIVALEGRPDGTCVRFLGGRERLILGPVSMVESGGLAVRVIFGGGAKVVEARTSRFLGVSAPAANG